MKRFVAVMCMVVFMASTGLAEAEFKLKDSEIKVSGNVEIHYRNSSELYSATGDDKVKAEELYLKFSKEVADNIEAMIKLDGADMDNKVGAASTHKVVEEAQLTFKNIAGRDFTFIAGKDEMPFGQDYEKFLISSMTHDFEIDKVWGAHTIYSLDGFGSIAAALFQRDTTMDVGLRDSYTGKIKLDKLVKNLSLEGSYAVTGKDNKAVVAEKDESRFSVAGKYKLADLSLHGEYTSFSDHGHVQDDTLSVIQAGADYMLMKKVLLKARYEIVDYGDRKNMQNSQVAGGISYYFDKNLFVAVEYEITGYADDGVTTDDEKELLIGAKFKF